MARRRPLVSALLGLVLSGCSGTPFGDQLSRSFSAPQASPPPQRPVEAGSSASPPAAAPAPGLPADQPQTTTAPSDRTTAQPGSAPAAAAKPPAPPAKPPSAAPVPYRLVLRLPGADPSAPAEAVTEALRAAGVNFEVEMVERVRGGEAAGAAGTGPPTATPAPAPR